MDYGGVVFIDEVAIGGIQKLDNRLDELILTGKANLALISFSRCGILTVLSRANGPLGTTPKSDPNEACACKFLGDPAPKFL